MSETARQAPRIIMDTDAQAAYSIEPYEAAHTLEQAGVQNIALHTIDVSSERALTLRITPRKHFGQNNSIPV